MSHYIDIVFQGKKFSPTVLVDNTGLHLDIIAEFGKIATKGRYKGKASPYGLAQLKINYNKITDLNPKLKLVFEYISKETQNLITSGVDEVSLNLESYSDNSLKESHIDKEIFRKIAEINACIGITSSIPVSSINIASIVEKPTIIDIIHISFLSSFLTHNKMLGIENATEKIDYLFSEKIIKSDISNLKISDEILASLILSYLLTYIEYTNLKEIPSFDSLIKEYRY